MSKNTPNKEANIKVEGLEERVVPARFVAPAMEAALIADMEGSRMQIIGSLAKPYSISVQNSGVVITPQGSNAGVEVTITNAETGRMLRQKLSATGETKVGFPPTDATYFVAILDRNGNPIGLDQAVTVRGGMPLTNTQLMMQQASITQNSIDDAFSSYDQPKQQSIDAFVGYIAPQVVTVQKATTLPESTLAKNNGGGSITKKLDWKSIGSPKNVNWKEMSDPEVNNALLDLPLEQWKNLPESMHDRVHPSTLQIIPRENLPKPLQERQDREKLRHEQEKKAAKQGYDPYEDRAFGQHMMRSADLVKDAPVSIETDRMPIIQEVTQNDPFVGKTYSPDKAPATVSQWKSKRMTLDDQAVDQVFIADEVAKVAAIASFAAGMPAEPKVEVVPVIVEEEKKLSRLQRLGAGVKNFFGKFWGKKAV